MTHTIRVRVTENGLVGVFCSCSPGEDLQRPWAETMLMTELAELADEHIESADRVELADEHRARNAAAAYEAAGWPRESIELT